jgi:hypothetical protein
MILVLTSRRVCKMNILKELEREFKNAIGDIQKHPEHINKYDLVGLMEKIEKRSVLYVVAGKKVELFDKKMYTTLEEYCECKQQETELINKIKDINVRFDLEECINKKEEIYSRHLYIEAFVDGTNCVNQNMPKTCLLRI